jgi:hypothetical protein
MKEKIVDTLLESIRNGALMQGVLTLTLVLAYLVLIFTGQPVPQLMESLVSLAVGFWMGGKVQGTINAVMASRPR